MAKATKHSVVATINWAKVFEDNRDMEGWNGVYEACDGAYTVDVELDEENIPIFEASGTGKKLKNDDGEYRESIKLVRKHEGPFKKAGGPPKVTWLDGTVYDYETEGAIGNGSKAEIFFDTYPTKAGVRGTRLNKLVLIEHIPYVPEGDDDD